MPLRRTVGPVGDRPPTKIEIVRHGRRQSAYRPNVMIRLSFFFQGPCFQSSARSQLSDLFRTSASCIRALPSYAVPCSRWCLSYPTCEHLLDCLPAQRSSVQGLFALALLNRRNIKCGLTAHTCSSQNHNSVTRPRTSPIWPYTFVDTLHSEQYTFVVLAHYKQSCLNNILTHTH